MHQNRIEGNLLTDDEIDKIYNNLSDQELISRNEKDVRGYLEILELIFESHDEIKLSETNILYFHKIYFHKKIMENGGYYKNSQNRVEAKNGKGELLGIVFEPTPTLLVPKEMSELINWYFCSTDKKTHTHFNSQFHF